MRILGIDPGYERLGIAVIEKKERKETVIHSECFQTPKEDIFSLRLEALGAHIEKIIAHHTPSVLAIESLIFNKNQKTAMRVAEVRGVLLYLAEKNKLTIYEYTPSQIKDAIIGYGKATKNQITLMIPRLITINKEITYDDEYDALAVALTASACIKSPHTKI